jgi:hypothetical protein
MTAMGRKGASKPGIKRLICTTSCPDALPFAGFDIGDEAGPKIAPSSGREHRGNRTPRWNLKDEKIQT